MTWCQALSSNRTSLGLIRVSKFPVPSATLNATAPSIMETVMWSFPLPEACLNTSGNQIFVKFFKGWRRTNINSTVRYPSAALIIRHKHHPISSASSNLKGCNLVCGNGWPISALTRYFSPIGQVLVPEIWWPNMRGKNHKKWRERKSLQNDKISRTIST